MDLMSEYKQSPELKKPAQAKWLNDDYVKFIRFAQWRIEQTGHGVLGFVTNHGYLDNPTFMDMRRSLLRSFDDIYLLDLHGNSKKKEKTPEGGKDENVFDIQQGVAIGLFVRTGKGNYGQAHRAQVWRSDLYGLREEKYAALETGDVASVMWQAVDAAAPAFLFAPQDADLVAEYGKSWSLREAFSPNGDPAPGIVTTHDEFAISWTPAEAAEKVERLLATNTEAEARELFRLCSTTQWNYQRAKCELTDGMWRERVVPILYRPFDVRWTVYDRNVTVHRRERVFEHFIRGPNLGLSLMRQVAADQAFSHVLAIDLSADNRAQFSSRGIMAAVPLWLYPTDTLAIEASERRSNLAPDFLTAFTAAIGHAPAPEDVLAWIYAVLYTPSYRARYADQLKRDFPRIPLPPNASLYEHLRGIGNELIALHVMDETLPRITRFDVTGDNIVDKVRWTAGNAGSGKIWINSSQYFDDVPLAVWNIHIGGYRVAEKWLKDRRRRALSYDDLEHYQRVIAALARTCALQNELDAVIETAGGWPLG